MLDFKTLKRLVKKDISALPVLKVSLLGDSATQLLATAIRGVGVDRGFNVDLYESDFNQIEQQVMDPTSDLHVHRAKYNILFQSTHKLLEKYALMSPEQQTTLAADRINFIHSVCDNVPGTIIVYNYPEIDDAVFGSFANKVSLSFTFQIRKLNYELMLLAQKCPNLFVCDLAALQNKLGRDFMFSPSIYISTEMLLSIDALPYVASRTFDIIQSIEGRFKKCLILDLDNTLWGGVVGDDGWENIQLGHGLGIGKAYTEFQQWVKKLRNRGIIVAVCSKNDESKAKEPFVKHPEMVLRLDDISVFLANWENKADNIRTIQQILNIGFDAMVFIDDNPFERNLVRENLPDVTVPELPEDPGEYLEYLYSLNLFETASYNNADRERTRQYQVEAQRVTAARKFTNERDFLRSLDMVSEITGFNRFNTPRVAQLSQRSNQFNLRTVRYTEAQIASIEADPKQQGFAFTLQDKFGDNGLIAVVILQEQSVDTLFIDSWFMSCRILKRTMENFTLNVVASWAIAHGYSRIIGEYIPTLKNQMVAQHYPSLGFEPLSQSPIDKSAPNSSSAAQYVLDLPSFTPRETCIRAK